VKAEICAGEFSLPDSPRIETEEPAGLSAAGDMGKKLSETALYWERLDPHKARLYSYILKTLSFSPDADDIFHDTVLRGLRYFRSFRTDRDFGAWIFGIAHNEIRSHWRKSRRRRAMAEVETAAAAVPVSGNGLVQEVYDFAARLEPRARDVFFLFYESGFSIAEIAGIAGIKEGHVKWILHQARNEVRRIMGVTDEE
jgi:RNA polymerase sigma-70 factor (ECF subfamily)